MTRLSFALAAAAVCVCSTAISEQQDITVTGKLSHVMAIGGESTGWAIDLDSETLIAGKQLRSVEIQPGGVRKLKALENKHVKATGTIVGQRGVETGERTVLAISSIEEIQPKTNLTSSEWVLEDLGGRRSIDYVKATLTFPEAGKVSGNASCNRFFGSVQVGEGVIRIAPLGSTRMACPQPVMDQESAYLKALEAAERYEVRDLKLLLYSRGFDKPLRFVKKQRAAPSSASIDNSAPASLPDLARVLSRAWRVTDAPSQPAPGSIYIFLSNGTLIEASCVESYRIAKWAWDKAAPSTLRVIEDNQLAFTAEIVELTEGTLRFRQKLARNNETRTLTLEGIEGEFVCPDLPK